MSLPIVVTHPSTLLHKGLHELFAKSRFRPVRIATSLTEELKAYLQQQATCVWLIGMDEHSSGYTLLNKIVSESSGVKAIVLAASRTPEDIGAAMKAGASGFLCQDMPGEQLLQSLELIALGKMVVCPQIDSMTKGLKASQNPAQTSEPYSAQNEWGDAVPSLSRREMLILRMLMQGASNKVIARNLVITESTVKVHMKAILRKLRLQNRTQAAIWARNNVKESDLEQRSVGMSSAH